MSGHVLSWAYKQTAGSASAKAVLVKLADNANDEGVCWPSIRRIADETELGRSTVISKIQELQNAGLISVQRRRDGQRQGTSVYQLHIARDANADPKILGEGDPSSQGPNSGPSPNSQGPDDAPQSPDDAVSGSSSRTRTPIEPPNNPRAREGAAAGPPPDGRAVDAAAVLARMGAGERPPHPLACAADPDARSLRGSLRVLAEEAGVVTTPVTENAVRRICAKAPDLAEKAEQLHWAIQDADQRETAAWLETPEGRAHWNRMTGTER